MTQHERHLVELALKIVSLASGVKDSGYSSTSTIFNRDQIVTIWNVGLMQWLAWR